MIKRMKRFLLMMIFIMIGGFTWVIYQGYTVIIPAHTTCTLKIDRGDTIPKYLSQLQSCGPTVMESMFKLWGYWSQSLHKIQAGTHRMTGPVMLKDLPKRLTSKAQADVLDVKLIEGFTRWHIADVLVKHKLVSRSEFLRIVEVEKLEGQLFPNTYEFKPEQSTRSIITRLTQQFKQTWESLVKECQVHQKCHPIYQNVDQALILASMVEKESVLDEERAIIAQVFYNRLTLGMKLQSDPTCVYSEEHYLSKPSPKTCHDSKNIYSTYTIKGLPPTPIANPGEASLRAVLYPNSRAKEKQYLFFVAKQDGSGAHVFNHSYQEHKKAIKTYLQ